MKIQLSYEINKKKKKKTHKEKKDEPDYAFPGWLL